MLSSFPHPEEFINWMRSIFANPMPFIDECIKEANQILLNTVWHDKQDPHGDMSAGMNRIADLLGIVLSEEQRNVKLKKGSGGSRSVTKDEFESYSSLVNNA
jgi:hypothetical protein